MFRKIVIIIISLLALVRTGRSQDIITVQPGALLYMQKDTEISFDRLTLKPSVDYSINTSVSLLRSATLQHASANPVVRNIYRFTGNPPAYRGLVRFGYADADLNGIAENLLTLQVHNNSTWTVQSTGILRNPTENTVTSTISQPLILGELALASSTSPLPSIWGNVSVECDGEKVLVRWQTLQEINSQSFIVESSADGASWTMAATIPAAGQSSIPLIYSARLDAAGKTFYRIRVVDGDGKYSFSRTLVSEGCGALAAAYLLYPSPASQSTTLTIHSPAAYQGVMAIYTNEGKVLRSVSISVKQGTNNIPVDLAQFAAGVYFIRVTTHDGVPKTLTLLKR